MAVFTNDVIRATAVMRGPQGDIQNVYYFRAQVLVDSSEAQVMADLAEKLEDVYGSFVNLLSSDTIFVEVRGYNVTAGTPMPTVPWPSLTAGGGSATDTPSQVAVLGFLRTGRARAIARKFFGGFSTANFDTSGLVGSNVVTAVVAGLGNLLGSFIAASLNNYLPGIPSAKYGMFLSFLEGLASGVPATQRRRRFGRGS